MTDIAFRSDMKVDLVEFWGGDGKVVQAARTSTVGAAASEPEEREGLIRFLMRERHSVPFEHSGFTFRIEAPIFVTRQILKHRTTAISEESGRYRELDGVFYVTCADRPLIQVGKTGSYNFAPADEHLHGLVQEEFRASATLALDSYKHMLGLGVAKEVARMVLPVNLYSSLYLTINARNLMHFLGLRNEHHAQFEIREVAAQMETIFAEKMPLTFKAWKVDK